MEPSNQQLVQYTNQSLNLALPETLGHDELLAQLTQYVQQLMDSNFNGLVQLLYRLDVSEPQLQKLLIEEPFTDAAQHISHLIVQRQLQKIESRKTWGKQTSTPPDEEAW